MNKEYKRILIIAAIVAAILVIVSVFIGFQQRWHMNGFGMMGRFGPGGGSAMMIMMGILWIAIIGLIIWAFVAVVQKPGSSDDKMDRKTDSSMEILKQRYARGEIDKEEFEAKKRDLN